MKMICENIPIGLASNSTTLDLARRNHRAAKAKVTSLTRSIESHIAKHGSGNTWDTKAVMGRKSRIDYFRYIAMEWNSIANRIEDELGQ